MMRFNKVIRALKAVQLLDESITSQAVVTFLTVADEEGLGVHELSAKSGMAPATGSRTIAALSDRHWLKRPGLDLVRLDPDEYDLRKKHVVLTQKGHNLADQIHHIMEGSPQP